MMNMVPRLSLLPKAIGFFNPKQNNSASQIKASKDKAPLLVTDLNT